VRIEPVLFVSPCVVNLDEGHGVLLDGVESALDDAQVLAGGLRGVGLDDRQDLSNLVLETPRGFRHGGKSRWVRRLEEVPDFSPGPDWLT
jgi:hypothetical protein